MTVINKSPQHVVICRSQIQSNVSYKLEWNRNKTPVYCHYHPLYHRHHFHSYHFSYCVSSISSRMIDLDLAKELQFIVYDTTTSFQSMILSFNRSRNRLIIQTLKKEEMENLINTLDTALSLLKKFKTVINLLRISMRTPDVLVGKTTSCEVKELSLFSYFLNRNCLSLSSHSDILFPIDFFVYDLQECDASRKRSDYSQKSEVWI
jgi:hypothetical protein